MEYVVRSDEQPSALAQKLGDALAQLRLGLEQEQTRLDSARRPGAQAYQMAELHTKTVNGFGAAIMVLEQVQAQASQKSAS